MRIVYSKHRILKLFNIKILSLITDYSERSSEQDDDFNDEMIVLKNKEIEIKD